MLSLIGSSVAAASPVYVYKGNGSDGRKALPAFEAFLGRKVDGVVDFIAFDSWTSFDNDANWGISGWKGSGYKLAESVPLTVNGTSLADVAAGKQDAHFTKLAQTLISNGFPDAYIRLGWEFNGGWYPWAFQNHSTDYINAFTHVVKLMRAVTGSQFRFVWNPALYEQQNWPDAGYPGDASVDVIATDAYNASWDPGYTNPSTRWNSVLNDSWGVAQVVAFAKTHNKPYAFPEWATGTRPDGHGGGDDPLFIHNMAPIVNGSAFSGYWDFPAADYNGLISGGNYPNAAKEFKADFASPSQPAPAPAPTPTPPTPSPTLPPPAPATPKAQAPAALKVGLPANCPASAGCTVTVVNNSDGSAVVTIKMPKTNGKANYGFPMNQARHVETWGIQTQIGWWNTNGGGPYTIHVAAN